MSSKTRLKIGTTTYNDIQLIGENILYNNEVIIAYYILPTINYSISSSKSKVRHLEDIYDMFSLLAKTKPNLDFTIEKINKVVKASDVRKNLLEGIKIYSPDYTLPYEFSKNIKDDNQNYTLLGIHLDLKDFGDIEEYSLKDTLGKVTKNFIQKLSGLVSNQLDIKHILKLEEDIYTTIKEHCARASKELVFYNYVSKLYPNYEISYDKLSYINESTYNSILSTISQTVLDNFGYFEMKNDGVDLFDLPVQNTFGCILEVKELPIAIENDNFPINFEGTQINIHLLKNSEAKDKFKQARAEDRFEERQANEKNIVIEETEDVENAIQLANMALSELNNEEIFCNFHYTILVVAISLNDLKVKVKELISQCRSRKILVSKSLTQAKSFIDNYVNVISDDYNFISSIRVPISSQLNDGSIVGDVGTDVYSYSIGEDI